MSSDRPPSLPRRLGASLGGLLPHGAGVGGLGRAAGWLGGAKVAGRDGEAQPAVRGPALRPRSAGRADPGLVRSRNEDALLIDDVRGVWAVADGMGGHAHGQRASAEIISQLSYVRGGWQTPQGLALDVVARLEGANATLRAEAVAEGVSAIGSTVVCLMAFGPEGLVAWCGDSRAYLVRRGEATVRLTRDHTVVQELVDDGALRAEDAEEHPHAHVLTRAVGAADRLDLSFTEVKLRAGDRFLLCSDGLTRPVAEEEITRICWDKRDPATCCEALVAAAIAEGGPDNVSVVVIDFA